MPSVRPWTSMVPATPAPGRVEEALGLVLAHAFPLQAHQQGALLAYLLQAGPAPAETAAAAARFGITARRVRQLVHTARVFARVSLLHLVQLVADGGIRHRP